MLQDLLAEVDARRDEIAAFLQALIQIPSVNTGVMPTGGETACCEAIRARLAADGIASEIVESAPGRGNLFARLPGDGSGASLLLMAHTDVVPAEAERLWTHPPFAGTIADGKVWGRGAADCKSLVAAACFTLALLRRAGLPLRGDLVLGATADEESGGFYGFGWVAEHAPHLMRADYALNEGGSWLSTADPPVYGLGVGEKGRVETTITAHGRSAHASRPWGVDNALAKAGRVLAAIEAYQPEVDVSEADFDRLSGLVEGAGRPTPETLEAFLARVAERDEIRAGVLRSMSRMTLTPTMLRAGIKTNSIPNEAVLKCDVRTLPWQDEAYVRGEVERVLQGIEGVDVDLQVWARSTRSPFGTPFTDVLGRALRIALDRDDVGLDSTLGVGFTDSQWARPLGVQAYGFKPTRPEDRTGRTSHAVDERIEVDSLVFLTKVYLAAAYLTVVEGLPPVRR